MPSRTSTARAPASPSEGTPAYAPVQPSDRANHVGQDFLQVLPMLGVDYVMSLSSTSAASGRYDFSVRFSMPDPVEMRPIVERSDISWDGGKTWRPAGTRCGDTSCKVQVRNQAGGHASLRVSARDDAGRTATQQVIDAYAVRP